MPVVSRSVTSVLAAAVHRSPRDCAHRDRRPRRRRFGTRSGGDRHHAGPRRSAGMTLEEKVGQLFVTLPCAGKSADEAHPTNRTDYGVDTPAQVVQKYHVGGVIYFNNASHDNIDTPQQIATCRTGCSAPRRRSGSRIPLAISTTRRGHRHPDRRARDRVPRQHGARRGPVDRRRRAGRHASPRNELRAMGDQPGLRAGRGRQLQPGEPGDRRPVVLQRPRAGRRDGDGRPGPRLPAALLARGRRCPPRPSTSPATATRRRTATRACRSIDRTEEQWRQVDVPPFRRPSRRASTRS